MSTDPLAAWLPLELGPVRLVRHLGSGGMGAVYLAELREARPYAEAGTRLAVKLLAGHIPDAAALGRFAREAQVGQLARHPALVRSFEAGSEEAAGALRHYIVMEYVEGETLRDLVGRLGALPEALLRHLGAQAAAALQALHEAGALHRDLKPGNVLITPEHQVKLMDFGLARLREEDLHLTATGQFVGTPLYAAPEQCDGGGATARSDLYAFGVSLFHAATGAPPWTGTYAEQVWHRRASRPVPRAAAANPLLSPFLDELLAALMAVDPGARPGSAAEVGEALERGEQSPWWRARSSGSDALTVTRSQRRARREGEPPFVGRDAEMARLQRSVESLRSGRGDLILVSGEAGIGKSRFLEAGEERIAATVPEARILFTARPLQRTDAGHGALLQTLVEALGDGGFERVVRGQLAGAPLLRDALLGYVSGLGTPNLAPRAALDLVNAAVRELLSRLARERPLAWLVDDAHLYGPEVRELLAAVARLTGELPLQLVIVVGDDLEPRERASLARLAADEIALGRLGPDAVRAVLCALLPSVEAASRLELPVMKLSDGNPLFVHELVRSLVAETAGGRRGAVNPARLHVSTPSSLRELVAGRVRELEPEERTLLDVAAVLGVAFDPDLVARVLERKRLSVLQALAGIERRHRVIRGTGSGFEFDHRQVQSYLYDELPPLLRQEYHALVAEAHVERRRAAGGAGPLPAEDAALVCLHSFKGNRPAEALPLVLPAVRHLRDRFQHDLVLELADAAIQTEPVASKLPAELGLLQGESLGFLGRRTEQRAALERAVHAADAGGDATGSASARLALGWMLCAVGRHGEARACLEDAAVRARGCGERVLEARAVGHLGSLLIDTGEYDQARERFEESRQLSQIAGFRLGEANAIGNLGLLALDLGHYDEARLRFEEQLPLCRETGDLQGEARALGNLAMTLPYLGLLEEALELSRRQQELCARLGYRRGEGLASSSAGMVQFYLGDLGAARVALERHLALSREIDDRMGQAVAHGNLGMLALEEVRLDEAREQLQRCLELSRALGTQRIEVEALSGLGEVARIEGEPAMAEGLLVRSLELRRALGASDLVASGALSLARLRLDTGATADAATLLREAAALADRLGAALPGPVPAAYLALLGERRPEDVTLPCGLPVAAAAETHAVLAAAAAAAAGAAAATAHRRETNALLERLARHLPTADRQRFWQRHPVARRLASGS